MVSFRPLADWNLSVADGQPGASPAEATALPATVPATVPGCVHTDLLAQGLIPDPYLDDNENRLQWIGRTDWVYETVFDHTGDGERTDGERTDLVCHGLDTVATVVLNGVEIGTTANMHRSYRFDVTELLRPGRNRLAVRFDSVYRYGDAIRESVGERPHVSGEQPVPYVRKMACNFGWDWGPTLATAGIWQPIGLETWSVARLAEVRPEVTVVDGTAGRVTVRARVQRRAAVPVTRRATLGDHTVTLDLRPDTDEGAVTLDVPNVDLWWPVGQGAQPLYPLTVTLGADGRDLDRWERRVGFRTVEIDTAPDADGTPFTVRINGRPVFVRGVNWIPDDVFVTRLTRDRLAGRLRQAIDAGSNLLRVWGGGRYESEDFYDLADEYGLMVGQDFLFACAAYPEEEPLASEVAAEAAEQVVRLMPHASLVWWCGNNENIWGYHDWGWAGQLGDRTWGAGYYHDVLPRTVARLDPTRPYWPGSPYSGTRDVPPNDPAHGTVHIWDVWNEDDYGKYREYRPRFVAEFGFQGPPTFATLRRSVSDDPLMPDSPGVLHHQKAHDGNGKLRRGLAGHFPEPVTFDDWHWATQLNQARAVSFGIEHFRSLRPLCMGTIVWQLNDCWPVTSWAAVDGDGRRKPLWYALRRSYADRLVTFQPQSEDGLAVVLVNDGTTPWHARFDVLRYGFDGTPLTRFTVEADVAAGGAHRVPLPDDVRTPADPAAELLVADVDGSRATWYFAEDVDLDYPAPQYTTTVVEADGGLHVEVTAATLLRDLTLFPDRLDPAASLGGTADRALVTLLPGERATFTVLADRPLDRDALAAPPVLRSANDLVKGRPTHP